MKIKITYFGSGAFGGWLYLLIYFTGLFGFKDIVGNDGIHTFWIHVFIFGIFVSAFTLLGFLLSILLGKEKEFTESEIDYKFPDKKY
ncbi:MAG: hypothetical protein H6577_07575 [Lewinellaceae bacterium]|nr:hypothetical protein [Saprospiraceae bacterium]MCB9337972.1 hypothetical protein [Lewinellaceae bacterium]